MPRRQAGRDADRVVGDKPIVHFYNLHFIPKLHGMPEFALRNGQPGIRIRDAHHPRSGTSSPAIADRLEILQSLFDLSYPAHGYQVKHGNLLLSRADQSGSRE